MVEGNRIRANGFRVPFRQGGGWWRGTISEVMVFTHRPETVEEDHMKR